MKIHREGYPTLILVFSLILFSQISIFYFTSGFSFFHIIGIILSVIIFIFFLLFFRLPNRILNSDINDIICPADGEVVVIEETVEQEYFKDKRIQVSVFMSPFNVHVNWYPVSGFVIYLKYHPGKFLVAWHPKSSTLNERSTVVLQTESGSEILVRQIAGAMARRIVTYSKIDTKITKNQELGYIKFGSRVDIFLPIGTQINVTLKDKVIGNQTIIGKLI
jgi:phosphatidylserine decarboxylase